MKTIYAYAGFSLGIAIYFLLLAALGLRTPDISIGEAKVNLYVIITTVFLAFTLYVAYKLKEQRS
ncbi:hypothetical protein [Pyrobaculum aerophilum]|uniref:Uncharacterized protein n=2 Tax=Pyrobaculum aerophilum TaxID=13773 RepID=Q8ZYM5_PYRAE|nr:hypothetical protein [Pyrobaculum aerophilum]AAL62968.1 hypothetical protein PAE0708 [Pyrobaculum aerophilum str. IM2]MCX8137692.1 hypothetical protein [Pyrobaculum aerophilum]HII46118.1 hypothetical protein [Pyrobaculum aerophilum]